jgi:hypothetical protein
MCDFEQNILKLLVEERDRLKVVMDKEIPLPYYKSLENGIESARKRLKECESKQVKRWPFEFSPFKKH